METKTTARRTVDIDELLDNWDNLNRLIASVTCALPSQMTEACAKMDTARIEFVDLIQAFSLNSVGANPLFKPLEDLVAYHREDHPRHDALHEDYAEECNAIDRSPRSSDLRDMLVKQAVKALGSIKTPG